MTKQELKKLIDEMAATANTEKMTEAGAAVSTYMIEHPEDSAEIMEWFNTAQQKMMAVMSGASTPAENKNESEGNFKYVFTPSPSKAEEFSEQLEWTYDRLCAEIENLKSEETKLTGLLLHTSGEPGFFDIQGWEMNDGEYADELFMIDMDEEAYDDDEYDEADDEEDDDYDEDNEEEEGESFDTFYAQEVQLFEAKLDIIGSAIARIHQEGKWAGIIANYPFTIYLELHDDGADTKFLIINNQQGATPQKEEVDEALKNNKKRKTAEDFYNEILRGN